ncbi:PREDICTED: uncharacterized protein LOC109468643 [Branchiostoma belcheri]|uniref:Uncharacterized protein LOC109468643 n=1 Tax=Branchiostoma belcheri TaxID=7741 RepID=A0A6P4YV03_BRABE|nr:PREDICTED: uncharacterized protein LOC109468643 [Branchiostoma belcheri]
MEDVLSRLDRLTDRLEEMADRFVSAEGELYGVTRRAAEACNRDRRRRAKSSSQITYLWEQHRQHEQQLSLAKEVSRLQAQLDLHKRMQARHLRPPDPAYAIKLEHERNNLQLSRAHALSRLAASNRVRQKLRERQESRHKINSQP